MNNKLYHKQLVRILYILSNQAGLTIPCIKSKIDEEIVKLENIFEEVENERD